jgi:hypothetical protein
VSNAIIQTYCKRCDGLNALEEGDVTNAFATAKLVSKYFKKSI